MDTHFLFILAAILIIISCLLWLASSACLLGKSHRIQRDINILFEDVGELAEAAKKVLKQFGDAGEDVAEKVLKKFGDIKEDVSEKVSKRFGDVREDIAERVSKRFGVERYHSEGMHFSGEDYPPENDDRQWRYSSQYHFPYFE